MEFFTGTLLGAVATIVIRAFWQRAELRLGASIGSAEETLPQLRRQSHRPRPRQFRGRR